MRLRALFLILIFCCLAGNALGAIGRLSGFADWRYGYYRADLGQRKLHDANYFTQQYSLLYQNSGLIAGGRGGHYDYRFGGEWSSLDGKLDGQSNDISAFHILYGGDVLFAPGGLPLRLHMYSQDLSPAEFAEDVHIPVEGILTPHVVDDLLDGQHIRSGVTLTLGVRNGGYLGPYEDIFGALPRLLVDYSEDRVRDTKSNTPTHYRLRNLAFVSLNKVDNWFHYRYTDYTDYINPNEDYIQKTFLLGTIDQSMRRHWIDLTNWIKVSADGTYTRTNQINLGQGPEKLFNLNLFGMASRTAWQGNTFTSYQRVLQSGTLEKRLEVPLYLNGDLNRETRWRFRFSGYEDRQDQFRTGLQINENDLFAATRVETFRQQRLILAPQVEVEAKSGDRGQGEAARATLEAYTNHDYRPAYDLFGSYSIAYLTGNGVNARGVDYLEQRLKGKVETNLSMQARVGFEQDLLYGNGTLDRTVVNTITPEGDLTLNSSTSGQVTRTGRVVRATSSAFIDHRYAPWHLSNRVEAVNVVLSASGQTQDQVTLRHYLRYDRGDLNANLRTELTIGGEQTFGGFGSQELQTSTAGTASKSLDQTTTVWYSPGRASEGNLGVEYRWLSGNGQSSSYWHVREKYAYRFYSDLGIIHKVAELRQELEYERFKDITDQLRSLTTATVGGDYYPISIAQVGAKIRFRHYVPEGYDEMAYYLTAGLNFQKLKVDFDYAYGDRTADADGNTRTEQRAEVHVRKIF